MRKKICAIAVATAFSMPAMADFIGVYAGVDFHTTSTDSTGDASFEDSDNFSGYIAFEHFIPLIPNAKLKYSDLDTELTANNNTLSSSLTSAIAYYELFDNGLFEFDLGLAYSRVDPILGSDADLIQGYAAAKAYVPGMNMYGFAEVVAGSITSDESTDIEFGLAYTLNPDSLLPSLTVRAGYRYQETVVKYTQENKGLFAGIEAHF